MGIRKYTDVLVLAGFIIFIVFALWFCKAEDVDGSYCYGCEAKEPDSANIEIKLTINAQNPIVPLTIISGKYNISGKNEVLIDTSITIETFNINMPTNRTYSVLAKYKDGNRIVNAVDGGSFDRQEQTGCENTCWQLIGGSYDVRLKNY